MAMRPVLGRVALGWVAVALIALVAVGGVGHSDEVYYLLRGNPADEEAVSVNVQNTGSVRRYLGLIGLRRYGAPFELSVWIEPPPGMDTVVLRDLEVLDGDREALTLTEALLPVEPVTVYQGSRRSRERRATYLYPEAFELSAETVTVRGSVLYRSEGGEKVAEFTRRFQRRHDAGYYTGL
jgi:hypothetical protein